MTILFNRAKLNGKAVLAKKIDQEFLNDFDLQEYMNLAIEKGKVKDTRHNDIAKVNDYIVLKNGSCHLIPVEEFNNQYVIVKE